MTGLEVIPAGVLAAVASPVPAFATLAITCQRGYVAANAVLQLYDEVQEISEKRRSLLDNTKALMLCVERLFATYELKGPSFVPAEEELRLAERFETLLNEAKRVASQHEKRTKVLRVIFRNKYRREFLDLSARIRALQDTFNSLVISSNNYDMVDSRRKDQLAKLETERNKVRLLEEHIQKLKGIKSSTADEEDRLQILRKRVTSLEAELNG